MAPDIAVLNRKCNVSPALDPQPSSKKQERKESVDVMKAELELNRSRLTMTRKLMSNMREEIRKISVLLRREMGNSVDVQVIVKSGGGTGFLSRSQEIINLRLKLTALKSQFAEPSHKFYYRGPFDPRKRFDLKMLPQKQENLFNQVLEDDKKVLISQGKPIEAAKKQLKDMSLMHRASRYRTKSLTRNIASSTNSLQKFRSQTLDNAKVVEYMINHQNLMKLMLNTENLQLDPSVPNACVALQIAEHHDDTASDVDKYKTLYERSAKEISPIQDKVASLGEKLDASISQIVEVEAICTENRLDIEFLKNAPVAENNAAKGKTTKVDAKPNKSDTLTAVELNRLVERNMHIREIIRSSALSNKEDFNLYLSSLKYAKDEFIHTVERIKHEIINGPEK